MSGARDSVPPRAAQIGTVSFPTSVPGAQILVHLDSWAPPPPDSCLSCPDTIAAGWLALHHVVDASDHGAHNWYREKVECFSFAFQFLAFLVKYSEIVLIDFAPALCLYFELAGMSRFQETFWSASLLEHGSEVCLTLGS